MDVDDEWELLSDEGFLEINDDGAGKQIYSRKYSPAVAFQMNYFICPPPSDQFLETPSPVHMDLPPPVEIKDPVSQVFFKKMKETEFVDMKVDSPKPNAVVPQMEANFEFEEEEEEEESEGLDLDGGSGANMWKWSLNGIGAICSFGVAAATFCIIVLTSASPNNGKHHSQKIHFQIYSDDKRMMAIAAVSGDVPMRRARITVGGYYDESL